MIWKNLRITAATMNLLKRYRLNLETQVLNCPERYPASLVVEQISLGAALHYLLDQQRAHTARAAKSNRKKRLKIAAETDTLKVYEGPDGTSEPRPPQGQEGESPPEEPW